MMDSIMVDVDRSQFPLESKVVVPEMKDKNDGNENTHSSNFGNEVEKLNKVLFVVGLIMGAFWG